MPTEIDGVVARDPEGGPNWHFERIKLSRQVQDHELQIRLVSTGICHTDVFMSSVPAQVFGSPYPKIIGHEGAGYVEAVGPGVSVAKVGDPVLLSYDYCGACDLCNTDQQPYCLKWNDLNTAGASGIFETSKGEDASGKYFGQSSFASTTIVQEKSVVNVAGLVSDDDLKLLSPLGCGLMTGTGAILNSAKAKPHDIIVVTGVGAVGLGAIMAAKIAGCKAIIAVDRVSSRLEIAKELGATHVLDTSPAGMNMAEEIKNLVKDQRISFCIETTGVPVVMSAGLTSLGRRGKLIQIGIPPLQSEIPVKMADFFFPQKEWEAHFLGNSVSTPVVLQMIEWWKAGKFPVEKIVKFFPAKDVLEALHGMESGTAIKPVLVW